MGAELRDRIGERQRELASRHELLVREDAGSGRHDDLLRRVFDATNDLIVVLDEAAARATRRRRRWALVLMAVALVMVALTALHVVPRWAVMAAAVAFICGVGLLVSARPRRDGPAKPPVPQPSGPAGEQRSGGPARELEAGADDQQ